MPYISEVNNDELLYFLCSAHFTSRPEPWIWSERPWRYVI